MHRHIHSIVTVQELNDKLSNSSDAWEEISVGASSSTDRTVSENISDYSANSDNEGRLSENSELNDSNFSRRSTDNDSSFVRTISGEHSEDQERLESEESSEHEELKDFSNDSDNDRRKQYPWENRILFDKSGFSVKDVLAMIRGLCLRFGLSLEACIAIVNFLKLCAGPEFESLNLINYLISKVFDPPEDKITFCFYCAACKATIECRNRTKGNSNPSALCEKCSSLCNLSTKREGRYYLMVDSKYQIEGLFQHPDVKTALLAFDR